MKIFRIIVFGSRLVYSQIIVRVQSLFTNKEINMNFIHSAYQKELTQALKGALGTRDFSNISDTATRQLISAVYNKNHTATNSLNYRSQVLDAINKYQPINGSTWKGFVVGQQVDENKKNIITSKLSTIINKAEYNLESLNAFDNAMRDDAAKSNTYEQEANKNYLLWQNKQAQLRVDNGKNSIKQCTSFRGWFPSGAHMKNNHSEPKFDENNQYSPKQEKSHE